MPSHIWIPDNCSREPCVIETTDGGQIGVISYIRRCRHHHAIVETRSDQEIFEEIVTENREPRVMSEEWIEPPVREDVVPRNKASAEFGPEIEMPDMSRGR